jgi:hypothetical protein
VTGGFASSRSSEEKGISVFQQQKDSKLNQDDLDPNDYFYEKIIFRRVRMFTPRFLP